MKHNFTNLEIWKLGRRLASDVYALTRSFPKDERYSLVDQMRRASISVISNISEGCGRDTNPQVCYFLEIALGSLCELQSQVYVSLDQKYINEELAEEAIALITKIRKMTLSFKTHVSKSSK